MDRPTVEPCLVSSAQHALHERISRFDWTHTLRNLDAFGNAVLPKLLAGPECDEIAAMYTSADRFRNRIVMSRHGYGRGEYQYFKYPLPAMIDDLRSSL